MFRNPLELPADNRLLLRFLEHVGIGQAFDARQLLVQVARAFSHLPYENLTKIIKYSECETISASRHTPDEILQNHFRWGTGGTCFSLTATLLHLVRSLGFQSQPILADRNYGPDTHCALLVWMDAAPHLLDPGFLLVEPVPLPKMEQVITTRFNQIVLVPSVAVDGKVELFTFEKQSRKYRLTYKTAPVDEREFLRAWDQSYTWDMMQYPLLTRVVGDTQHYQRGRYQQTRQYELVTRREVPASELASNIHAQFGIDQRVVEKALVVLKR